MSKALELFDLKTMLDYTREKEVKPYLGEMLFPINPDKIEGSMFEYMKGANDSYVTAHIHAPNSEAEIASREGAEKIIGKLETIKRKIQMDEEDIIAMENFRNKAEENRVINKIFSDVDNMSESCRVRIETLRMEALCTGQVAINENGVKKTIDFGIPATNFSEVDWVNPSTDVLAELQNIVNVAKDVGVDLVRALTTNKILQSILKNTSIRKAMYGTNADRLATKTELNTFLASMELPTFETYDKTYREEQADGTYKTKKFMAEDIIVFMPRYELGETLFGVTAEEIRFRGKNDIDFEDFGNIIAYVKDTDDPVASWTYAVTRANISFPQAGEIFISKNAVKAAPKTTSTK